MNNDIINRIELIMSEFGVSTRKEFAENIDVLATNFSQMMQGKRNIGNAIINKIVIRYPRLNKEWLLTGEGSMLKEKETGGNHFRGDGNSYINVGSGTLSQNAKETNSEMYVKRIAELEEENKELRHKIDQLTADLLKSKERIINLLERE